LQPTTIAALERGEQDMDVYDLYRVAGALGVDMRALLPSNEEIDAEADAQPAESSRATP
jgi:transcriptional regulator with XRE-family HTH domain